MKTFCRKNDWNLPIIIKICHFFVYLKITFTDVYNHLNIKIFKNIISCKQINEFTPISFLIYTKLYINLAKCTNPSLLHYWKSGFPVFPVIKTKMFRSIKVFINVRIKWCGGGLHMSKDPLRATREKNSVFALDVSRCALSWFIVMRFCCLWMNCII